MTKPLDFRFGYTHIAQQSISLMEGYFDCAWPLVDLLSLMLVLE